MTSTKMTSGILITTVVAALLTASDAANAMVDMGLSPADQAVCVGSIVRVDLVLLSGDATSEAFDSLDALLSWDPAVLQLVEVDDSSAETGFFLTGFLPDADGINTDLTDGDAIYTALVSPGQSADAPPSPDDLVVTTFVFQAVASATATDVRLLPTLGVSGMSRVLLGGAAITGTITDAAIDVNAPCLGDTNCDAGVNVDDLINVILDWGTNGSANNGDVDDSGQVDVDDLVAVILAWGECP